MPIVRYCLFFPESLVQLEPWKGSGARALPLYICISHLAPWVTPLSVIPPSPPLASCVIPCPPSRLTHQTPPVYLGNSLPQSHNVLKMTTLIIPKQSVSFESSNVFFFFFFCFFYGWARLYFCLSPAGSNSGSDLLCFIHQVTY